MDGETITKKDLVIRVAELAQIKQNDARDIFQQFIDEITNELMRGNRIELRGFGVFEVKERKGRTARNPKTGEQVAVPAKRIITIKAGKRMRDLINSEQPSEALKDMRQAGRMEDDD